MSSPVRSWLLITVLPQDTEHQPETLWRPNAQNAAFVSFLSLCPKVAQNTSSEAVFSARNDRFMTSL